MGEPTGAISSGEECFERWRRMSGFIVAPALCACLWLVPTPGLDEGAHRLLAVFGLVIGLWLTEAIPLAVTAVLGPALCVLCGVVTEKEAFRGFGNPIVFLFLGSFILAEGMLAHGLNRRIAFGILGHGWVGRSPTRLLGAFAGVTCLVSMWMSNTTATAMMYPIGLAILGEMARRRSTEIGREVAPAELGYGTGLMLAAAFASSIGGMMTPVGSPPNLIGIGFIAGSAGVRVTFFQWMAFSVPLGLAMVGFLIFYLNRMCPPATTLLGGEGAGFGGAALPGWSRGERNVVAAFGVTLTLWLLPGMVALATGAGSAPALWLQRHLPEGVSALVGAALLFVLPLDWRRGEFTLGWKQACRIDWGTILLFGGGLSLGELMFSTGLARWLGEACTAMMPTHTELSLTVLFAVMGVLLTEVTSNTAAATMIVPVAIAMAKAAGVNPVSPAVAASLGCSLAFMLPVSTPPNAIVYGSGCVPLRKMLRHGVVMDLAGVVLVIAVAHWLVPLVLG